VKASQHKHDSVSTTQRDRRWKKLLVRDPASDGKFFYGVRTTGVYCRPSCASRLPRPENVVFYPNIESARRAGFRACKRCKPDQPIRGAPHAERIARACRVIENASRVPKLGELAAAVGLSPYHFHRTFRAVTGLTPRKYALAHRAKRVRTQLERGRSVTDAIYDAGYGSSGRFYEKSDEVLGMSPSTFRTGGRNNDIRFAIGECSLGSILVAQSARGICAISLGDDPEALIQDLQDRFPKANLIGGDQDFEKLVARVVGLVEAPALGFDLPLDVRGTAFQQRVWQALRKIRPGETASYRDIAAQIGSPKAVRAVAQACAANALAVAIPCHRVVRNDGALSGYRWGVARKVTLLQREAQA
jgi:AraC family transcriptional regulator, regulatory protein of adaptative response / methylated-DNA-[protein]-cysteine methyltransferase